MSNKRSTADDLFQAHCRILQSLLKTAGKSLLEALKDEYYRQQIIDNHIYNLCYSVEDNPYKEMTLRQLDNRRMLLDYQQFEKVIETTNKEVKKEAKKSIYEAIDEVKKELKC